MRSVSKPALLFAACACAAQPCRADQLRTTLLQGNLLRIVDSQQRLEPTVMVCLATEPDRLRVSTAETLTSMMFAGIRVKLEWHEPPACPDSAKVSLTLMFVTGTPDAYFPGALGAALPLEGRYSWVFYDRVLRASPDENYAAALLAHVMAHEIAHLIQGIIRHSESGILKAHWSGTDYARMVYLPLTFTREDATLIHRGPQPVLGGSAADPKPSNQVWVPGETSLPVP